MADRAKLLIMGAAGRDFHNFNVVFRDNLRYEVVASAFLACCFIECSLSQKRAC